MVAPESSRAKVMAAINALQDEQAAEVPSAQ